MSKFDKLGSLLRHDARRQLTPLEIEQMVRQYRAVVLGEMIADACLWMARVVRRVLSAKSVTAVAPSRSIAR